MSKITTDLFIECWDDGLRTFPRRCHVLKVVLLATGASIVHPDVVGLEKLTKRMIWGKWSVRKNVRLIEEKKRSSKNKIRLRISLDLTTTIYDKNFSRR